MWMVVCCFGLAQSGQSLFGQQINLVFTGPVAAVPAGSSLRLTLVALNVSSGEVQWSFPAEVRCRLLAGSLTAGTSVSLVSGSETNVAAIPPGGFARRQYALDLPVNIVGQVVIEFTDLEVSRLVLDVLPPVARGTETREKSGLAKALQQAEPKPQGKTFDPARFFREHFFPYEPFYFIAWTESPNAKFQFSFKYQLLNNEGPLAEKVPGLKGFYFGYTQTSLWDWNQPSAPFLDSSYKPELLYLRERVVGGGPTNWLRLDLQPGLQHESNGQGGTESRSLNNAYIRPTLTLGREEKLQFTLQPQAWIYIGDLSDNPDIARYRGYAGLRTVIGWQRGVQLSALGRLGDRGDRGSLQLDLTYPMMQIWSSFSVYLDLQYFIGYGESLLLYNERSSAFRFGVALYR
jgi:phospholipase A1/A2